MKRNKNLSIHPIGISNLKGLKVVIVGGTGGIGRGFSRLFAQKGANVVVVGQTFRDADIRGIEFVKADLSLMREAKRVANELPAETADLFIFTTGIMASPRREETAEGIERDMAISYLSRLIITQEIAPRLGKNRSSTSTKPRVFIMGYPGTGNIGNVDDLNAEKSYKSMSVHMNTVAGNEALVLYSATHYLNANFYGLNPGFISTNIRSNFMGANSFKFRLIERIVG